jgi:hypothetical protein
MSSPLYDIGDAVYLAESAQIGYLEPVRITGITKNASEWVYTVSAGPSLPIGNATYGDRVNIVNGSVLYFSESEFVDVCSALRLARSYYELRLSAIDSQLASLCG